MNDCGLASRKMQKKRKGEEKYLFHNPITVKKEYRDKHANRPSHPLPIAPGLYLCPSHCFPVRRPPPC